MQGCSLVLRSHQTGGVISILILYPQNQGVHQACKRSSKTGLLTIFPPKNQRFFEKNIEASLHFWVGNFMFLGNLLSFYKMFLGGWSQIPAYHLHSTFSQYSAFVSKILHHMSSFNFIKFSCFSLFVLKKLLLLELTKSAGSVIIQLPQSHIQPELLTMPCLFFFQVNWV